MAQGVLTTSHHPQIARLTFLALALAFTYVFLANHWLGDDAYITFRTAWNFVHGFGPNFNPDERVQAFTHPLWLLAISAAHGLTGEFYFTVTFLLWACGLLTLATLIRWAGSPATAIVIVVALLTSKAYVDYSASGLEYPLSFLLLAIFYTRYLSRPAGLPWREQEIRWYALIASLGFVTRPDAAVLYALPLAGMLVTSWRVHGRRTLVPLAIGVMPALLWLGFATFYYGFPLPNTYYAKVANGIPKRILLQQGAAYLFNSLRHDPITLGTIGLALGAATQMSGRARLAAVSAGLYVAYTVTVGGDFMSGRFFAMPFLIAVMTVGTWLPPAALAPALVALFSYNVLMPLVPIKTTDKYTGAWAWRTQNGIKDERGHYHQATNILFFRPFGELPDLTFAREGMSFGSSAEKVTVQGSIGMFGLYAGPSKFIIDRNALSEPLLARLPVSPRLYFEFYASHYFRDIPAGYLESVAQDRNLLEDPLLHEYYDRLRNVTRGPLWSASRVADIWQLNAGRWRRLHDLFERAQPISLSIRAANENFRTDVGDRDMAAGALRASGRPGFLQYGPGIPLKAGQYRVRWVGTIEAPLAPDMGFVGVWHEGRWLTRLAITSMSVRLGSQRIAEIDFELPEAIQGIEFRLYVNADVRMLLERVELFSRSAIPND